MWFMTRFSRSDVQFSEDRLHKRGWCLGLADLMFDFLKDWLHKCGSWLGLAVLIFGFQKIVYIDMVDA
jgi:hypothetical protein